MKITKSQLKQIIKEELGKVMAEDEEIAMATTDYRPEQARTSFAEEAIESKLGFSIEGAIEQGADREKVNAVVELLADMMENTDKYARISEDDPKRSLNKMAVFAKGTILMLMENIELSSHPRQGGNIFTYHLLYNNRDLFGE